MPLYHSCSTHIHLRIRLPVTLLTFFSWKICFSPQGNRILTASSDKTARLWDVQTGVCLQVLEGHTDEIFSCVFNYEGDTIITGIHCIHTHTHTPSDRMQLCPSVQPPVHVCAPLQGARITHAGSGADPSFDRAETQADVYMDTTINSCRPCMTHCV